MPRESDKYWATPGGEIVEVSDRHILEIIREPEKFGLTKAYIDKVHKKHGEKLAQEGNAREEILTKLIELGWVRARYIRAQDEWFFQVVGPSAFVLIKKLCKHILKGGGSDYSAVRIIDLAGNLIGPPENTILETAEGSLDKRRKVSQFAEFLNPKRKRNPRYADAYWMSPDNKIMEVSDRHITLIVTEPETFGLTKAFIAKVHKKHGEPVGSEGYAREEIMAALIANGWLRARYVRGADSWTFQTRGKEDNGRVKKLCAYLLKHDASIYSQAVVIDLSGFRLDGGEDTLSEVAAGALERKRKVSQFAEFLNPGQSDLINRRIALFKKHPEQLASKLRVSANRKLVRCPYCESTCKIIAGKIARHGFSFERISDMPQHEKGNYQSGECPGTGVTV
jgi:hypothetical protein